jgi:serine/threonine protein kinase/tetratricopeptide (TPR) repeat protein
MLGDRYEVLQLLGEGGMGAVYKAKDRELDRIVALKVIRPELARQPEIHQRFKQELILARQVTHKNVIRIFDLGDAEGTKFISMEYIEGQDLKTLLRQKGKFSPEEAVAIIQQVCRALYAAHEKGVIHRDLKPQNIMMEKHGNVSVMDFGIARSMEAPGVTRTGALIGTFEYMSPEQARGEKVDARSDLFTLGIIFYELLTGGSPFQADTPTATLLKRLQEQVVPPVEVDPAVPRFLSEVVVKCLQIDPELRYQSAAEILQDLEARRTPRSGAAAALLPPRLRLATVTNKRIAAGLGVVLLAFAGFVFRDNFFPDSFGKPSTSKEPITLAILPFRNASGDQTLDWLGPSLAEMLRTDIGQSSHLRTVSSDRLYQILQDLRIAPDSHLDPATLRRLAEFSNAETLVWGQYLKLGEKIRIDATIHDLKRQREIPLKAEAVQEEDLLDVIGQLAQSIQENLSLSSDIVEELRATAFRPSSSSIQALRYYNEGLQLGRQGNHLEAAKRFEASIEVDSEFALAYSMLGQTYANLGYDNQAEQSSRKAVDRSEELPSQEKYRVLANHAWILNDHEKAIEAYENLAKVSPTDADVHFNLAGLYEDAGSFDLARDHYAKVLEHDPKYGDALFAMGRVEFYRENPQGSLEYFNRGLSLAIQLENEEAKATFLNAVGNAYKLLNKSQEALKNFQEALAIRRRLDHKRGMASSLSNIAQMQADLGNSDAALASYQEAL